MLILPAKGSRQVNILLIYDRNVILENYIGLAQVLGRYGNVSMPDLPGFGGMDSFFKVNRKPILDNFADYLASFVKLRFKRRRFVVVGCGFGFVIATRMLQRYPELAKRVDLSISLGGYSTSNDFSMSRLQKTVNLQLSKILSVWLPYKLSRMAYVGSPLTSMIRLVNADVLHTVPVRNLRNRRTMIATLSWLMDFSNCDDRLAIDALHVSYLKDVRFKHNNVEQHMGVTYAHVTRMNVRKGLLTYEALSTRRLASTMLPRRVKQELRRLSVVTHA